MTEVQPVGGVFQISAAAIKYPTSKNPIVVIELPMMKINSRGRLLKDVMELTKCQIFMRLE
jgi:hypothetical protein